jgi:hypothetical protein
MPDWLYQYPIWRLSLIVFLGTVVLANGVFELVRRYALFRFEYHDGANDAISGALGAIGVFYGVTVGLIAIDVWQRHSDAEDIAAREAAAIQTLYLTVRSEERLGRRTEPPQAQGTGSVQGSDAGGQRPIKALVADYLQAVICKAWVAQRQGGRAREDWDALKKIRQAVLHIDPVDDGQAARYAASIQSLNQLSELRRLRADAANDRLAGVMWTIILVGAAMTLCVAFLFRFEDGRLHHLVIFLLSGFLSLVVLMIIINDRPFLGDAGIEPSSYTELGWMLEPNPFKAPASLGMANRDWREACKDLGSPPRTAIVR